LKFELKTVTDTEQLGALLWEKLPSKSLVFLKGELGAGKTTLVRGVLR
jgi:tRNA threonylcarbamoyladenosine biosynthesis protein TsaE